MTGTAFRRICIGISVLTVVVLIAVLLGLFLFPDLPDLAACLVSAEIWYSIVLSLVTAVISTAICLVIALPVAYAMSRHTFRGKAVIATLLNLPLALPPLVAGVALLIFFSPALSPVGQLLKSWDIYVVFTPVAIVIAQVFVNTPYLIRTARAAFESVSPRYEYVGRTLGCTEFAAFRRITLPMAKPGILSGIVITWAKAMGEFGAVLMLAGSIAMKTQTLPIALYTSMSAGDMNQAVAASLILIVISAITLLITELIGRMKHV